jgi:hypothetical protein
MFPVTAGSKVAIINLILLTTIHGLQRLTMQRLTMGIKQQLAAVQAELMQRLADISFEPMYPTNFGIIKLYERDVCGHNN